MRAKTKAAIALTAVANLCRVLLAGLAVIALASCGGGGGDEEGNEVPGLVTIEAPTESPTYATASESVVLAGSRNIPVVSVRWSNAAGGSGEASLSSEECTIFNFGPFTCNTEWAASIPLVVGANVITVTASDSNGSWGRDSITITRLPGTRPPTVSLTFPTNGATNFAVNNAISAVFSEQMASASITEATFQLVDGNANPVSGSVTYTGNVATFTPANLLVILSPYTATITDGVKDLAGNPMAANYVWSFATGAPDTTPPTVTSTSPANGADAVDAENIRLLVTFSESIDPSSVNSSTFILKDGSENPVNGAVLVANGGNSAEFRPSIALANSMSYTAVVTIGIADLAGHTMAADYSWTFVTAAPRFDTWQAISNVGAPSAQFEHTTVWTGSEMIVWGGGNSSTGARYNPVTDVWAPTSNIGAPSGRSNHTAVWTGSEMIVWGGVNNQGTQNTGARYNPVTDTWVPTSTTGAPSGGSNHTVVWSGREMIVWGVINGTATSARYNPVTDTWLPTSATGAPSTRYDHTAVWTGSEMIVWGGSSGDSTGARYNPSTDTWLPTSTTGAPSVRSNHTAVWTGSEMIVWGGSSGDSTGARYNPSTDTWLPTSTTGTPSGRSKHTAVWTGSEMIVWGGHNGFSQASRTNSGARYNVMADVWAPISNIGAPSARFDHTAIWTASEMIICGGLSNVVSLNTGGRYRR